MGIILLKIIGVLLITALGICLFRRLANNFNAWKYEREHIEYLRAREECRREQKRKFKK